MNLDVVTETFGQEDHTWLGSEHGTSSAVSITMDVSKFVAGTHYPNGFIPSGCALGIVTATQKYGPYDDTAVDGRAVFVGHLLWSTPVRTGATNVQSALLDHGRVVQSKLPFQSGAGAVDAAAKTDVGNRIRYV